MTPVDVLKRQIAAFRGNRIVRVLLNATDMMVLILNGDRYILYGSDAFCRLVGAEADQTLVGLRIGNAWQCIHAGEAVEGCGGSESCRHCSVFNTLSRAISSGYPLTEEASVLRRVDGVERSLNILEHVVPTDLFGESCYIVTLMDISDTLHRRWMERLFFHDILNKVGALSNYLQLLAQDVPEPIVEDFTFLEDSFRTVLDDIRYQKQLMEAEAGMLRAEPMTLVPVEVIEQVVRLYRRHDAAQKVHLRVSTGHVPGTICSDYLLLRRVLENMLKNALEAASGGETVEIGCESECKSGSGIGYKSECDFLPIQPDAVRFWVRNAGVIPPEVQSRIFQRSFSTKGPNRGMGTYSMKLIGEQVLGGSVGFASSEEAGTEFFIVIPREGEFCCEG